MIIDRFVCEADSLAQLLMRSMIAKHMHFRVALQKYQIIVMILCHQQLCLVGLNDLANFLEPEHEFLAHANGIVLECGN